jgi:short-subunit dehydrogenase involved in D-alanine esterification of teichoic acids
VAIVTGGSRGVGRAVARRLTMEEYAVVIDYINRRDITVNAIALGPERPGAVVDVAELVAFLVSEHGWAVDGQLIRASGVNGDDDGPATRRVAVPGASR